MNVVFAATVERLNLVAQPHPQPYKIAWLNKMTLQIEQIALVSISYGSYVDDIWCDVIPMNATHILLGRPWLYDRDVYHCGKENTYYFLFNGKRIVMKPMSPDEIKKRTKTPQKTAPAPKQVVE
uniref:Uncharacterized protein n=1 Tax=Nelumbo nucifera TaxID=4432 RepID=A0A822YKP2_NELNU|nr:TPA_asm: hypothetical protein HUJ06_010992 [Nelumbo nucifera]